MLVRICRYYKYPDIKRQTPNQSFVWQGITFTEEEVDECDFLIILDYPKTDFSVKVHPNNILHISLEPANEVSKYRQYANSQVSHVFNQIATKDIFTKSQPALPWHLDLDYDAFKALKPDDLAKEDKIVWVTSNQRSSKQHNERMDFLDSISNLDFVKLYGRGINPVDSKLEVMKTAKYAIAYENFKNPYNWTEKISDCFLSFTVPLYYGCDRVEDYFPKEAIIQIDPKDKHIKTFLKEIVTKNKYQEKLEALSEARNLVLDTYQIFPFFTNQINAIIARDGLGRFLDKKVVHFKGGDAYFNNYPKVLKLQKLKRRVILKLKNITK
jgi:hypothetical protein